MSFDLSSSDMARVGRSERLQRQRSTKGSRHLSTGAFKKFFSHNRAVGLIKLNRQNSNFQATLPSGGVFLHIYYSFQV